MDYLDSYKNFNNENFASFYFNTLFDRKNRKIKYDDITIKLYFDQDGKLISVENKNNFEIPEWGTEVSWSDQDIVMDFFDKKYRIKNPIIKYGKDYKGEKFNLDKFYHTNMYGYNNNEYED